MLIKTNKKIILASTSQIRQQLLTQHRVDFEAVKPFFDEDQEKIKYQNLNPKDLAIFLAKQKALSVSEKFPDCLVIGADQACEFEGKEISKSKNSQEAISQLQKFSGKIHFQNNATIIAKNSQIIFENFSKVELKMHNLTLKQIEEYVNFDQSWGCAGSYKYESLGKILFSEVNGDYFAILGLAIQPLLSFLYQQKIINF
jgi:septum formation protein